MKPRTAWGGFQLTVRPCASPQEPQGRAREEYRPALRSTGRPERGPPFRPDREGGHSH